MSEVWHLWRHLNTKNRLFIPNWNPVGAGQKGGDMKQKLHGGGQGWCSSILVNMSKQQCDIYRFRGSLWEAVPPRDAALSSSPRAAMPLDSPHSRQEKYRSNAGFAKPDKPWEGPFPGWRGWLSPLPALDVRDPPGSKPSSVKRSRAKHPALRFGLAVFHIIGRESSDQAQSEWAGCSTANSVLKIPPRYLDRQLISASQAWRNETLCYVGLHVD